MSYLVTFSGKFGDILWSMPTVVRIAKQLGFPVHFRSMPQYESLMPLISKQPYIASAGVLPGWICSGSPHGDQPWLPQSVPPEFTHAIHLTYKMHPSAMGKTLVDAIAAQQGLVLTNPLPFIETKMDDSMKSRVVVAYSFNEADGDRKKALVASLQAQLPHFIWVDVSKMKWELAAEIMKISALVLCCRSAGYVLAHGVGARVVAFEPMVWRREAIYGCPYGYERLCATEPEAVAAVMEELNVAAIQGSTNN